jgi:hypothetical protein
LAHVDTRRHMSAHVGTCRHTSAHVGTRRHMSTHVGARRTPPRLLLAPSLSRSVFLALHHPCTPSPLRSVTHRALLFLCFVTSGAPLSSSHRHSFAELSSTFAVEPRPFPFSLLCFHPRSFSFPDSFPALPAGLKTCSHPCFCLELSLSW